MNVDDLDKDELASMLKERIAHIAEGVSSTVDHLRDASAGPREAALMAITAARVIIKVHTDAEDKEHAFDYLAQLSIAVAMLLRAEVVRVGSQAKSS